MSLRRAIAVPFRTKGRESLPESEFVVALSLDRDWFSPDQAKRLVDVATTEGLLERDDDAVAPGFDPSAVSIPEGFTPDESILRQRSTFERTLDAITEAGTEKQVAVAAINRLQADLGVTIEAAAIIYAHREGIGTDDLAERVAGEL